MMRLSFLPAFAWGFLSSFIFFCTSNTANAQDDPIRFEIDGKHLSDLEGLRDQDYFAVWGTPEKDVTEFFLVNRATKKVATYRLDSDRFKFLGSVSSSREIRFYVMTKFSANKIFRGESRMECVTFYKDGEYFMQELVEGKPGPLNFSQDETFYRVSWSLEERTLKIISTDSLHHDNVKEFHTGDSRLRTILKDGEIEFIEAGKAISYERGQSFYKMYAQGEMVYLISDDGGANQADEVVIFAFNTRTGGQGVRTFSLGDDNTHIHNSFLFKEHLYVFSVDKEDLTVSVFNFISGEQASYLTYTKGQPVDFQKSPLMINGHRKDLDLSAMDEKAIAKQQLRILKRGTPFIMVEQAAPGAIRLLVGSRLSERMSPGGMSTTPGLTVNTPQGPVTTPGTSSFSPGVYQAGESNYFYGYLDGRTFDEAEVKKMKTHGPTDAFNTKSKAIRLEKKTGGLGIIYGRDNVFLVYVDKKTRQVVIENIP